MTRRGKAGDASRKYVCSGDLSIGLPDNECLLSKEL